MIAGSKRSYSERYPEHIVAFKVQQFESDSTPGKFYTVKQNDQGDLSCDCKIWIYNKRGDRTCKHTEMVQEEHGQVPVPVDQLAKRIQRLLAKR